MYEKAYLKSFSIILCTLGSIPVLYYFASVDLGTPFLVLLIGVGLISLSNLLAILTINEDQNNYHFVYVLFITSLILFSMYRIRFNNLSPGDVIFEYRAAKKTLDNSIWSIERSLNERYLSSVSVSLIPSIISNITGLDLLPMFIYMFKIIASMIPVSLYYLVSEIFNNKKIAAMTSIIFVQFYFNLIKLMNLTRQQFSEFLFILTLLYFFKIVFNKKRFKNSYILITLLIFSFITFHYTVMYFSLIIFLSYSISTFILEYVPKKLNIILHIKNNVYNKTYINYTALIVICIMLLWNSTINFTNFKRDILTEINSFFYTNINPSYPVSFLTESPLGPIVTNWIKLAAGLSVIGFITYIIIEQKNIKNIFWVVSSGCMYLIMAYWLTPRQSITGVYPDRIYLFGFIFFSSFIAYILYKLYKTKYFKILPIIFLCLNLPMNMFLPTYQNYVHYTPETNIDPKINVLRETFKDSEYNLQLWINEHIYPQKNIYFSYFSGVNFYEINSKIRSGSLTDPDFTFDEIDYIFLDHIALQSGLWRTGDLTYDIIDTNQIMNQSCVIFNNGRVSLVSLIDIN